LLYMYREIGLGFFALTFPKRVLEICADNPMEVVDRSRGIHKQ